MNKKMFVVSRDKKEALELSSQNKNVGYIKENNITFYPDDISIVMKESETLLNDLNSHDIVEICDNGKLYKWYSSKDGDAGIATTPKCNSNCIMCPAFDFERQKNPEMDINDMINFIRLFPKSLYHFTITGGEPTLIGEEHFCKVLKTVSETLPYTEVLLLTNGRSLAKENFFKHIIKVLPNNFRIAIPIHGSDAQKHDYIVQSENAFDQTLKGIYNVLKAGIFLELRIVVSKLNKDDITNIAKLIIDKFPEVGIVHFIGLEMRGNCIIYKDDTIISYEEAFKSSAIAIDMLLNAGINVGLYNFPYCMIDRYYWPIAQKSISAYKSKFYEECNECIMKEQCCGLFTTSKAFLKPKVTPIGGKYD